MATVTLAKPVSKYSTDVWYCLQVEKNAQSALIACTYCRDVGQIGPTVGSHLKNMQKWPKGWPKYFKAHAYASNLRFAIFIN